MSLRTPWRKTAATIYTKPTDGKIIGSVELDATDLNAYIRQQRKQGIKLTLTQVIALATARAIAEEIPEMNTFIRRGEVVAHPSIDAMISVLLKGGQMGFVKLVKADQLSVAEGVEEFRNKVRHARTVRDEGEGIKNILAAWPWPLRNWLYRLVYFINIRLGISLPGLSTHTFGSFVVSNIGSLGLEVGYPALFPVANVPFVLIMGGVRERPWVVDGEIVARDIFTLSIAMDHRMIDASHGGKLFKYLKRIFRQPSLLEQPVNPHA